jgi:hypothetical protein
MKEVHMPADTPVTLLEAVELLRYFAIVLPKVWDSSDNRKHTEEALALVARYDRMTPVGEGGGEGRTMNKERMTMKTGQFHWQDGWMFSRDKDGAVVIENEGRSVRLEVPQAEWASIASHVSARGEAERYSDAVAFHAGRLTLKSLGWLYLELAEQEFPPRHLLGLLDEILGPNSLPARYQAAVWSARNEMHKALRELNCVCNCYWSHTCSWCMGQKAPVQNAFESRRAAIQRDMGIEALKESLRAAASEPSRV